MKQGDNKHRNIKNILMVPHTSTLKVRVRSFEIGKTLAGKGHNVFYWHYDSSERNGRLELVRIAVSELFKTDEIFPLHGVSVLRTSRIYKPQFIKYWYNNLQLERIVDKYGIDAIICADFSRLARPRGFAGKFMFDYVDDTMGYPGISESRKRKLAKILALQFDQSDYIIASSDCLFEQLEKKWKIPSKKIVNVANGVQLSTYLNQTQETITELRRKYGLPEKRIISFIGNHAKWSGIDFVYDLFDRHSSELEDFVLLLVGPSYRHFQNKDNIMNLGSVPWGRIPELIRLSDCGLLPFQESDFTSHALPLKVIEYSILGKPIISSPLRQLQKLDWPNLLFVPLEDRLWVEAIRNSPTKEIKVPGIDKFDWDNLVERLEHII
jgi:glycosyltransferase involved in cell wall biosynthesis